MCTFIGDSGDFGKPAKSSIRALKFISIAEFFLISAFAEAKTVNWEGWVDSPTPHFFAVLPTLRSALNISHLRGRKSGDKFSRCKVKRGKMSDGSR